MSDRLKFNNILLGKFLNALNLTVNRENMKISQFVSQFDSDYDGYLTKSEFYNLIRNFEVTYSLAEFNRISHLFSESKSHNQISVYKIL